jgi:hypothetical protein
MILRRLTEHVKDQNWFAVALDFLIVVFGVFIGLQVSNWNAHQAEKRRADDLLARLVRDLDGELASVQSAAAYYETTSAYARVAMKGFEQPDSVPDDLFVISAYQASQNLSAATSRSTFDEMISTGALSLVSSGVLRERLVGYFEFNWSMDFSFNGELPYREHVRRVIPYRLQVAIKTACGDQERSTERTILFALPATCEIEWPAQEMQQAAAALRAEPGLDGDLRFHLSAIEVRAESYHSIGRQLMDLIEVAQQDSR